jgi:carbamoyltransferase
VAASLQAWLEESIFKIMNALQRETGMSALCLAGGVALNSCTNGKIFDHTSFRDVFIQPAAGDNGTSVGAAYYVWNQVLGNSRRFVMDHAYTGPEFGAEEVRAALERQGLAGGIAGISVDRVAEAPLLARSARAIADGKVVGFFQGRMEFGPRALGNRSIVADPRRSGMKDVLNSRIKHREAFRPFAPSILEEFTSEYFERSYPSPTMLMVYKVREEKRSVVPAITHVDGTGRLQTVSKTTNRRYWSLIDEFRKLTGVPLVLNTSFNENEPIVCTPDDALTCFLKTRMDVLVLGDFLIERSG